MSDVDYGLVASEALVGSYGGVLAAPVGTPLPEAWDDEPNGAFVPLGYLSPTGPSIPTAPTIQDIRAWQSADPIDSRVTERSTTVEFELMQWNPDTVAFAYGGGTIEAAGTGYVFKPSNASTVDEFSLILDVVDGEDVVRYVFERGYPASGTTPSFNRDGAAVLSVGYKVLTPDTGDEPWRLYTNIAGWGGS